MNKAPQTPKGFRDFLPQQMTIRNEVIGRLRTVFEKFGFEELQTPALEYQEVLLGKYGPEAERLMYLFQDPGERKVGLKYDLTVPLARVAASNQDLPKPFKRYQIQPVWRAENPQKGRYREFYQCDVDTIGITTPLADAEILAIIVEGLHSLKLTDFKVKINSRQVLFSLLEKTGIDEEKWMGTLQSIDKLDKKSEQEVREELDSKGLEVEQISSLFANLNSVKPDKYLSDVLTLVKKLTNFSEQIIFEPHIVRGLDYYTGPIFETVVETAQIGSVTGGGRYDNLIQSLGGPDLAAVGTTIGLDRICDVIETLSLWGETKSRVQVLVSIFSPDTFEQSCLLVQKLRSEGIRTELYLNPEEKLEKQLKYADKKGIGSVLILGPEEIENNVIKLKDMKTGDQQTIDLQKGIEIIKELY